MYLRVSGTFREPKTYNGKTTAFIFSNIKLSTEEYKSAAEQKSIMEALREFDSIMFNTLKNPTFGMSLKLSPNLSNDPIEFAEGKSYDLKLKLKHYNFVSADNTHLVGVTCWITAAAANE
jgi:hypothetical protein